MTGWWRRPALILGAIAYVYVGSRLSLPGVDVQRLVALRNQAPGGLLGLYELVFAGGLHRGALLTVGIMPYLTARIWMRLARIVSPRVAALGDHARIVRTRWLTGALAVVQSFGVALFLQRVPNVVANPGMGFTATTVLALTGASLVAMWFGEKLTETDDEPELSDPPERPEAATALLAPEPPASPLRHPLPSSAAETPRTRR